MTFENHAADEPESVKEPPDSEPPRLPNHRSMVVDFAPPGSEPPRASAGLTNHHSVIVDFGLDPAGVPPPLLPRLLHAFEFITLFAEPLGTPRARALSWRSFAAAAVSKDGALFNACLVLLVGVLYRDLPAADNAFLGRPLTSLTWPELLRQYLLMVALEHQAQGAQRVIDGLNLQ
ncbi:hypothetical protein T484DRAFT_1805301, partial [Baffinella frigidus]